MVIAKESINLLSNSTEPDLGQAARRGFLPRRAVLRKVRLARRVGHDRQTVEGVAWQRDWTKTIRTSTSIAGTSKPTSRSTLSRFACARVRAGSQEGLDLAVLLERLKKEFHFPAVLINGGDC